MNAKEILAALPRLRIAIVGDVCLDRWCSYDPAEAQPSRETGLDRIAVVSTEVTAGAAGTVANNLAALGVGSVEVIGAVGGDGFGFELKQALAGRGIGFDGLVTSPNPTFTYTKLINAATGEEDRPRVDFIWREPLAAAVEAAIIERLRAIQVDAIIVADQAEHHAGGVITPAVRSALAELKALTVADSRNHPEHFRNVILKPNEDEARAACARLGGVDLTELRRHTSAPLLAVTHGGKGVRLILEAADEWIETRNVPDPVDICGAGDSFCAGFTAALAAAADAASAARFGNQVASVTIMKKGTGTASPQELIRVANAGD